MYVKQLEVKTHLADLVNIVHPALEVVHPNVLLRIITFASSMAL